MTQVDFTLSQLPPCLTYTVCAVHCVISHWLGQTGVIVTQSEAFPQAPTSSPAAATPRPLSIYSLLSWLCGWIPGGSTVPGLGWCSWAVYLSVWGKFPPYTALVWMSGTYTAPSQHGTYSPQSTWNIHSPQSTRNIHSPQSTWNIYSPQSTWNIHSPQSTCQH